MELLGVALGWVALYLGCTLAFALCIAAFFSRGIRMWSPMHTAAEGCEQPTSRRTARADGTGGNNIDVGVAAVLDIEPLLWITVLVPTVTFFITYPISIWFLETELRMDPALHFLSTSLNHPPASCIGSFSFSVTLPAALLAVLARYLQHTNRIAALEVAATTSATSRGAHTPPATSVSDARVNCCCGCSLTLPALNQAAIVCGLLTILGAAGVAAFQWVNSSLFHSCAALLFFVGGLSYPILDSLIEGATVDSPGMWVQFRGHLGKLLSAVWVSCVLTAGGGYASGAATRDDIDYSRCSSVTCGFADWFIMLLATFEISLFCGILGYFAALVPELRGLSLSIHIVEKVDGLQPTAC